MRILIDTFMYEAQGVYMTSSLLKLVRWNNGLNSKVMKNGEQNPAFKGISHTCHFQVFLYIYIKKSRENSKIAFIPRFKRFKKILSFTIYLFIYF